MIALVRHGETDTNRAGRLLGRADPPLNERGRAQVAALAQLFADGAPPVAVVSSPLGRARETAAAIADAVGVTVELDERLVEVDYGEWDGRALGDMRIELMERWRADPDFVPPGGESLAAVTARAGACAAELLDRAGSELVIAVSHVSPIKGAVAWALGAGAEMAWRVRLDVASVTRIVPGPDGPVLLTFNERPR